MKKFLLSILCLVGFVVANADEVAFVADGATYDGTATTVTVANGSAGNIAGLSFSNDNVTITHTQVNSTAAIVSNGAVRWYQNDKMTFTPAAGITITKIEACIASGSKGAFAAEIGTVTGTGTSVGSFVTWEGSTTDPLVLTAAKQVRFSYLLVTYTKGEITTVSMPSITPNGGEISATDQISISCETEGAAIYYTIDGTEPSATNGTLYSAPFTLSAAATVKAIAVDPAGALSASSVTEVQFSFPVANIAEFISEARSYATSITGTVTVVAQSGSYLFLQDETSRIIAFGTLSNTYNNGDQLTGVKGVWNLYNGLPEMNVVASSFGTATAGPSIEPETITIEEVAIDNLLAYVKIEGVSVPESSSKSITITDETGSMTMYNTLGITVPTGENLTVIGFISCYNTTVQIMPLEITSASGLEVVEAPVISPDGGTIATNQEITITCATEGASIYYTVDSTEPSATNGTLYSAPFSLTEECTVKAIAVADGMENSAVTEAAFTFLSGNAQQATFNFTAPSSLNPAQEEPALGNSLAVVVNDVVFTAGEISLSFAKNEATTDCRIWAGSSAYDLRTYSTSTMTIAGTNVKIKSIEFTGSKISADSYMTADSGTFTDKVWSGDASTVVFTTVKTTNINTITVTYEKISDGVENIEVDENAPVEYYNLQGVKVANPESGLYIRVQGNKATKVIK